MASRPTGQVTNGHANRKLTSWIDSFIELSKPIESPVIHRKWAAIGAIAAALEQKVWIQTTGTLFPNMYIWLVGDPGVGKSRAVTLAGQFLRNLPEFHIAPTSITSASLVDFMVDSKVLLTLLTQAPVEYNSGTILADELTAFTSEYDQDMVGVLTKFYDVDTPYGQKRRGKDINIFLKRPQLNMIIGVTPSNLMKYVPAYAWDQGFTSRLILVHSNEFVMIDNIFEQTIVDLPPDMVHDLNCIRSLYGEFIVDETYRGMFHQWRQSKGAPAPTHPRLTHYCTRRWAHVLKLSMVSCVDRGDSLLITGQDFVRARDWLLEAEQTMPQIFQNTATAIDAKAQDELLYFVRTHDKGSGVKEDRIIREARKMLPINAVKATIDMLVKSGMLEQIGYDNKFELRILKCNKDRP
jgi:hypothetical protein